VIPGKGLVSGGLARTSPAAVIPTLLLLLVMALFSRRAEAVPAFASQTGQPCSMCHIGAFGPQLTPFGRAFKIGGYTQRGGEGLASEIPLALMVQGSFTHTGSGLEQDQIPHHYAANNNFSIDQVSLFLAGGIGQHAGGFMQFTYSPVDNATHVDNTDLRPFTSVYSVGEHELRVGVTLNNNPTVQDPYNSTFAWGYPFIMSAIAPTPAASVMLASGFNNNVVGYTAYAWYDKSLYLEAGAYNTWSPWTLARFGTDYGIGATTSPAPYLRAAYEWNWNGQSAHAGTIFMSSNVNPTTGVPFQTNGSLGANRYTDLAVDGGYQFLGDTHILTLDAIYTYEWQNLGGTAASVNQANAANGTPTAFGPTYSLNEFRLNASYWYQNTYGVTLGWQKVWGPANPVLYQPGELTGSANSKPNSNAFIIEADWVPFGKEGSWARPFVNLKLGVQFTLYTQFNGGTTNYDGFGRNASANNTLFAFAWLAF
jgi:hypothetical protein